MMSSTAILIDGGFCLKRMKSCYSEADITDPVKVADLIHKIALSHLYYESNQNDKTLPH